MQDTHFQGMSSLSSGAHYEKTNNDRNTRTYFSAGWEGFYQLGCVHETGCQLCLKFLFFTTKIGQIALYHKRQKFLMMEKCIYAVHPAFSSSGSP